MDHSLFDNRKYPVVDAREGYGEWAKTYEQIVQDVMDLRMFNWVQSVDWASADAILDLACGTGRIGQWLRQQTSAPIDGVDFTPEMLSQAQERGLYRNLTEGNITQTSLPDAAYDLCVQSLADEHLPELEPLYAEVARLTRPGGQFVIVGVHPQFFMQGMPTHFDRDSGETVTIRTYVHLLSDHVQSALAAGWTLQEMHEGLIDDDWMQVKPKWRKHYGQPISFVMVWRKNASAT